MSSPNFSILFSAKVDGAASAGSAGDVLIPDSTSGEYVKATAANRGTRRSTGIALASYVADGTVEIQQMGQVAASISGLGTGTASWVRVSATGVLERCTPGAGDDVVGRCETDGTFHAVFGVFDSSNYAGGGGGGTPGGSNTQVQYNNSSAFGGISGVTTDGAGLTALKIADSAGGQYYTFAVSNLAADRTVTLPLLTGADTFVFEAHTQTLTNKTISGASNTVSNLAASAIASGTLVHERGGLEADVSAYSGLVKITGGATSAVSLGTGVETFLTTPSGANLASALTTALPASKGGTGQDTSASTGVAKVTAGTWATFALGTGVETFLTTPSGANLASALSTSLPNTKGGTGQDSSGWTGLAQVSAGTWSALSLGANVATFLGAPSSANLASAVTDETGSGALVFGTSPTLSSPTLSGTPVVSATSMSATGNARGKVYSDIASVQTTDATVTSLFTWTITDEAVTIVTVEVCAVQSTGATTASYVRRVRIKRDGGTVTVGTVESTFTDEEAGFSTCDVTIDNSTSTGRVRVTGVAATTIDWACVVTRFEVTHA